jgi:polyhydroxyalkanoate synthesis regulator phasin
MNNATATIDELVEQLIVSTAQDSNIGLYTIINIIEELVKRIKLTSEESAKIIDHVIYREKIAEEHIERGFDAKGERIYSEKGYMKATRVRARGYGLLLVKEFISEK